MTLIHGASSRKLRGRGATTGRVGEKDDDIRQRLHVSERVCPRRRDTLRLSRFTLLVHRLNGYSPKNKHHVKKFYFHVFSLVTLRCSGCQ